MNTNFGKLDVTNQITYAPDGLVVNGALIINPRAEHYAAAGWLAVNTDEPTGKTGVTYVPSGWEARDGAIYRTFTETPVVAPVRQWTPLSIKRACGDKWATVKAALEAANLYDEFLMCQYLASDDAAFQQGYEWAVSQYGAEAVNAILDAAEEL